MQKERQSAADVLALESKAAALSEEEDKLGGEIEKLNTTSGIDEEIKQKFNVSAEGEHVAVIIDPANAGSSTASSSESWYTRAWNAILTAI
jgi:cell division protein FtsB